MSDENQERGGERPSRVVDPGPLSRLLQELADASGGEDLEAWREELAPGDRVGRFEIRREVGRGGFGAVYAAVDTELNRVVAVKTLRLSRKRKDLSSDWMKKESEAVARLDHPCIVTLFDVGTCDSRPYLVMELLRGKTLAQRIADGPIAQAEALRIAEEMARGLAHAHQRGVLHRDLKPANVFLCEDGRVKLLDFGLAHLLGSPDATGAGTPAYMAPEQARGEEIDARADVYAAAMVLREMWPELRGLEGALSPNRESRPRDGTAWMEAVASLRSAMERPRRMGRVAGLVLLALAVGGGAVWMAGRLQARPEAGTTSVPGPAALSIAVLPFTDLSPEQDQAYFAEGVAEEILGALSRVRGMRVPGRSSSFWFKGKNVEPAEIARKLGVSYLLEGSVRRSGSKVRISAEVVNASSGARTWSQTYEREITDVFAIQDEIARAVVQAVAPVLFAGSVALPPSRTTDPEAYRLFLLGRYQNSQGTEESFRQAIDTLERSAGIDPRYAPAQALLAFAFGNLAGTRRGDERARLRRAGREAAERAVELDPESSWGYAPRALQRLSDLDWHGAAADLDHATSIDPSSQFVLNARSIFLATVGRTAEAVEVQRRAVEQDPLSAIHTNGLAMRLTWDGRYAEAREWARRAEELSPGAAEPIWVQGWAALLGGDAAQALAFFEKVSAPRRMVGIAAALGALGRLPECKEAVQQLERDYPDEPILIAGARAGCGDIDGAFGSMEVAVQARDRALSRLRILPHLRPLHSDPRFPALLRRLGFPEDGKLGTSPPP
jgi:serine/threonine protein kinase/Flp pilus assembly protein TadD